MPLGAVTQVALADPIFADILWKMTPASLAVRLSQGRWHAWPYLQLLSRKLVDVAMGRCPRLIVVMPPRHGKSEAVSHWLPVWYLETFPNKRVILCSYEADFAAKWGGKARDTVEANQDQLTVRFKVKNPAMHHWETSEGGAMMCAGVGGPITGKGADILIIDDFVKNREEGKSFTMREKMWEWYTSTARTRLEPGGAVIVMATRWDSDDLIGRIIDPRFYSEKGQKEEWEVFCFPAVAEPESERHYASFGVKVNNLRMDAVSGLSVRDRIAKDSATEWTDMLGRRVGEPLCPDRFDSSDLSLVRGSIGERDWYALYQQRPGDEADDGNVYHAFVESANCKQMTRDPDLKMFVAMDFNVDPMCAVIGQYDQGMGLRLMERAHVFEELVLSNSNTYVMCERLVIELRKYKHGYVLEVEVYGDAAGSQRSPNSSKTNWQIVSEHFALDTSIHVKFIRKKANPNVGDRVNAVNSMLRSADGTVRVTVDDVKCPELVKDFKKVRWDQDSGGNSVGNIDKGDKKRTHVSDALGYFIDYRFGLRGRSGGRKGLLQ